MPADPYQYFRIEANELIEQLDNGVLELDRRPNAELVGQLLRVTHTLKGAARVVKLPGIADTAHAMEDALTPYRHSAAPLPAQRVRDLLDMVDWLRTQLAAVPEPQRPAGQASGGEAAEDGGRTAWAGPAELDELLDAVNEASARVGLARHRAGAVDQQIAELLLERVVSPGRLAPYPGGEAGSTLPAGNQRTTLAAARRGLADALEHVDRRLRHVREIAEQLRLTPAAAMFTALARAARDVADEQHKQVVFEGRGGEIRLGPHIIREVHKALSHVVRNAVAHGVETEPARRAAGKSASGQVVVEVSRHGKRICFTCRDDGRGFDLDAVRAAVRAADPAGPDPAGLSAGALFDTLLRGGVSTSATVSEVSGRGIGLDVVRAVAERLGGDVTIRSEPGRGASVELVVPVSLVSLDGLAVQYDGRVATIPLEAVRRTVRVQADEVVHTTAGDSILHEGQAVAFAPLARLMSAGTAPHRAAQPWSVVLVGTAAAGTAAIGVDRILGPGSVILRPLPDLAPANPVVAGAALDPDGTTRLVLDPDGLVAQVRHASGTDVRPDTARPPILVVDDSLTTRMLEQSILESVGYTVDTASSAELALDKARDTRYGLFLVDVEMPGIDGFTLIERMRADANLRDIPAILVTSRAAPEDRRRGVEVGADGYVLKGEFDQTALLQRIGTLLAGPPTLRRPHPDLAAR